MVEGRVLHDTRSATAGKAGKRVLRDTGRGGRRVLVDTASTVPSEPPSRASTPSATPFRISELTETPLAKQILGVVKGGASEKEIRRVYETQGVRAALQAIQRYAPAGTQLTTGEALYVMRELLADTPSAWQIAKRAFIAPEILHPESDPKEVLEKKVGILERIGNTLRTPQRALTATILTHTARGKTFGRESGQPVQVQDWASVYAADPTFGSLLEAVAPQLPQWARVALGFAADVVIDPLILASGVTKGTRALGLAEKATAVGEVGQRLQQGGRVSQAVGKALERTAELATREVKTAQALERSLADNLASALGVNPTLAQQSSSPLRAVGLGMHYLLDPVAVTRAVREAWQTAPQGERLQRVFRDLEAVQQLRSQVAYGDKVSDALQDIRQVYGAIPEAVKAEAQRLTELQNRLPTFYSKALAFWKSTKTIYNPPSTVRNFLQNFVFRHLTGEATQRLPQAIARLVRDKDRFIELWRQTENASGQASELLMRTAEAVDESAKQPLWRRVHEFMARAYEGADRLAAVLLAEATGKPPQSFLMNYGEIPRTMAFLRDSGLVPFVAWQYFAAPAVVRGLLEHPHRTKQVLQPILASAPYEEAKGERVQVGDREIGLNVFLPINPAEFSPNAGLLDPGQVPAVQLGSGLSQALQGEGETMQPAADALRFLRDFLLPPAFAFYIPGVIAPPPQEAGKRRTRERLDYLLGLLGIAVRPTDPEWDRYWQLYRQRQRERRKQRLEAK
jgi:hypothetical protein